jgi:hypothetical protein
LENIAQKPIDTASPGRRPQMRRARYIAATKQKPAPM